MRHILSIFVFLSSLFLAFQTFAKEDAVNIFAYSRDVPKTQITHESGKKVRLSDFKGQFVVAMFWSRTCGPCVKELEDLNTFYKAALKENIRLVLISPQKEWKDTDEQRRFLTKYRATDLDFYTDNKGNLAADFGIFTTPHTVLINEDAQEIGRIKGTAKWADKRVLKYIKSLKKDS